MTPTPPINPAAERALHLDVLRGFALLGILLVNFRFFTEPLKSILYGSGTGLEGIDLAVAMAIATLAEGKFYALFSMLFGAGFALMAERLAAREAAFRPLYLRRLGVLLGFGALHMVFVWAGDILLVYALAGFLMTFAFARTPASRLWKWAVVLISLPTVLAWAGALSVTATRLDPALHAAIMQRFAEDERALQGVLLRASEIHASGSYLENVGQRLRDGAFTLAYLPFWATPILGYFLLGRWLLVSGILRSPQDHPGFLQNWLRWGLLSGLPCAAIGALLLTGITQTAPSLRGALGATLAMSGAALLSLAYLAGVVLAARRLAFLAPAGQMALSNYLCQSLFWTWAIYGHGLGLWGQVPVWSQPLLAIAFFSGQVALSHWWLRRYRYGPAEWLWRSLTYGCWQPVRRSR